MISKDIWKHIQSTNVFYVTFKVKVTEAKI